MFLIFKKPEYRRFNLKPRYWDPAKEEREERERRVKAELGLKDDDKTYIPNIKGQFRQEYEKRKANRNGLNSIYDPDVVVHHGLLCVCKESGRYPAISGTLTNIHYLCPII